MMTSHKHTSQINELSELLNRKRAYRETYAMLRNQFADHPNLDCWLRDIQREVTRIDDRIALVLGALGLAV
jgi:hypothetical protein